MYQMTNGMGAAGRPTQDMSMMPGSHSGTGNWKGQNMGGAMNQCGGWQTAGDMFANMPGSMQGDAAGSMNGGTDMSMNMMANMPGDMMNGGMAGNMTGNMAAGSMAPSAHTSTPMEGSMRRLDLDSGLSPEAIENPTSLLEARLGSLRGLMMKLVGHYVIATFLMGVDSPVSWEGFLYNVGNDYIVIFQPENGRYVTGDLFSLKFVEFYEQKGVIPACVGMRRRDGQNMW